MTKFADFFLCFDCNVSSRYSNIGLAKQAFSDLWGPQPSRRYQAQDKPYRNDENGNDPKEEIAPKVE